MAAALCRGALRWIRRLAFKRVARVGGPAARVRIPPPAVADRQGVFYDLSSSVARQALSALLQYICVSQSPAGQHRREHHGTASAILRPVAVFL
jgi:hypothetical protein